MKLVFMQVLPAMRIIRITAHIDHDPSLGCPLSPSPPSNVQVEWRLWGTPCGKGHHHPTDSNQFHSESSSIISGNYRVTPYSIMLRYNWRYNYTIIIQPDMFKSISIHFHPLRLLSISQSFFTCTVALASISESSNDCCTSYQRRILEWPIGELEADWVAGEKQKKQLWRKLDNILYSFSTAYKAYNIL